MIDKSLSDIFWVLITAGMVFMMQPGFLCLEAGMTRAKNSINVAIKNIADLGICVIIYWMFGFALMFGAGNSGIIGSTHFFVSFENAEPWFSSVFLFQMMFCGTAVTIISGAVAERMRFSGYLIATIIVSAFIYPVFGHWAWGGLFGGAEGWLAKLGFVDFAGSSVVHSLGGWAALAAALVIGPRQGRFPKDGAKSKKIPGCNLPMSMLGVLLLWFGWLGFNGGSAFAMTENVPGIIVNTILAGAAGIGSALALGWFLFRYPAVELVMGGGLAGLVAITASSNAVDPVFAIIIGAIGAIIMLSARLLLERLRIDDVVGVISVHGAAGAWGAISVALFGNAKTIATGLSWLKQLQIQVLGCVVCFILSFGLVYLLLSIINRFFPLRVTEEQEHIGLNVAEHKESTEILDLLTVMDKQARLHDLSLRAPVEPFTEIGQIAELYNRVMNSLQEAEAKTSAIIRTAVDGIVTFLKDELSIISINPAGESIFGYPEGSIVGRPAAILFDGQGLKNGIGEAIFNKPVSMPVDKSGVSHHEALGKRADGAIFPMEVIVSEVDSGDETFYVGTFRDITERKLAEESQKKYNDDLSKLADKLAVTNKELEAFCYSVSHDLRAPLRAINGFSEALLEDYIDKLDEQGTDYIHRVCAASQRMGQLIDDLLTLSRITRSEIKMELVDLSMLANTIIEKLRECEPERKVKVIITDNINAKCDKRLARIALENLLQNAWKFTNKKPIAQIEFGVEENAGKPACFVRDNGAGFDMTYAGKLFAPFQRLHSNAEFEGTGIGLATANRVINRHNGRIWANAEEEKGATFYFTL